MSFQKIMARESLDFCGNPTVEVDLLMAKGWFQAAVPRGASTGIHEALELQDGDKSRHLCKGVLKAMEHVNKALGPALVEQEHKLSVVEQEKIDKVMIDKVMIEMDGTENKREPPHPPPSARRTWDSPNSLPPSSHAAFGADVILGVSLAVCKAGAAEKGVPLYQHIANLAGNTELVLPVPAFNVIDGGSHVGNNLVMQEFTVLPVVVSVEDPFDQNDTEGWKRFLTQVDIQVVGDDLTVTNLKCIAQAAELWACNCLLLEINQIRSVTESIQAYKLVQSHGWGVTVSDCSGETEDTFIGALIVALCAGQIEMGAPCRSECLAKHNQLMRVEEVLGDKAKLAGRKFQNPKAK